MSSLGSMPLVWSGSSDPDLIWRLEFLACVSLLLWLEGRTEESDTAPPNKIKFYRQFLWKSDGGVGHPLACRGGEERRHADSPCSGSGACWGDRLMLQKLALILLLAGRGGEERKKSMCCCGLEGCKGEDVDDVSCRSEISMACAPPTNLAEGQPLQCSGSFSSSTHRWHVSVHLLKSMAVGQPIPPYSSRCWRRVFFLQALMPMRRSSCSEAVCSRCSTPSGHVPGGSAVGGGNADAVEKEQRQDQDLIAFFLFSSKVFSANSQGHGFFLIFVEAFSVTVTPPLII